MLRLAVLLVCVAVHAVAAPNTERVFSDSADGVVKIQIVAERSESGSIIGTGFYVGDRGHVITNYHVVSKAVFNPKTHHAQIVLDDESIVELQILAIDVVHDLAVVQTAPAAASGFRFADEPTPQGARIYSLGHPHDLGLAIIEGTFNGRLDKSFLDKFHLTVSLNPGMSGGPTIDERGDVIGVNVATAGNQVSFVIPAARARDLMSRVLAPDFDAVEDLRDEVRDQLIAHQAEILTEIQASESLATTELGGYAVPGEFATFLDCWGDDSEEDDTPYELLSQLCSTRDAIFVEPGIELGSLAVRHRLVTSDELDRFRFYSLYASLFGESMGRGWAKADDLTTYVCETDYVEQDGLVLKTVFCARRYRKLAPLHDILFKTAILGRLDEGLESSLLMTGVTFATGRAIAARFLSAIRAEAE